MGFCKWMDKQDKIVKIIFCLPVIDILWAIYRIVGCFKGSSVNILRLILAIIWIFAGAVVLWLLDLICVILFNHICWWTD